jgi:hypothetical protein
MHLLYQRIALSGLPYSRHDNRQAMIFAVVLAACAVTAAQGLMGV